MKKEYFLFIILTIFIFQSCATKSIQNLRCKDFRTGTFELINLETNRKYIIERNSNFQIEKSFDLKTHERVILNKYFFIEWIGDCEYILKMDTLRSAYNEVDLIINEAGGMKNKILSITANCAKMEVVFDDLYTYSTVCKK